MIARARVCISLRHSRGRIALANANPWGLSSYVLNITMWYVHAVVSIGTKIRASFLGRPPSGGIAAEFHSALNP
ncbi:protein of unknown function [Hyphomicrobium sp. MC1]|nr:protein of unknown function [Hyphomicrobium sp. MC1]